MDPRCAKTGWKDEGMTVLKTEQLVLEPTRPALFDGLWAAIQASLTDLRRWMPWAIDPKPDRTKSFMDHAYEEWQHGHERHFTMLFGDQVCGQCSLDHADPLRANYEMGYWMRSDLCGQGLTTEAARGIVHFAFDDMAVHRIELHVGTENLSSIRVAEKLGFSREGLLRESGRGAGGFYDSYVYGLLASDRWGLSTL